MNSWTYKTPMLSVAPSADIIPRRNSIRGCSSTAQHDFVANQRQVNGQSVASDLPVVEGVADQLRVVGGVA